jgi:hypothetical protein
LALYWHIGATTMRFGTVRSASFMGENKALGMGGHMMLEDGRISGMWRATAQIADTPRVVRGCG